MQLLTPSDIRPGAIAMRVHELARYRRPDMPSLRAALGERHAIVMARYLPPDEPPPSPAAPAMPLPRAA